MWRSDLLQACGRYVGTRPKWGTASGLAFRDFIFPTSDLGREARIQNALAGRLASLAVLVTTNPFEAIMQTSLQMQMGLRDLLLQLARSCVSLELPIPDLNQPISLLFRPFRSADRDLRFSV